ncbi:mammalian cell entry protein [Mycolicibacterium elephantis]|uniref:MCE family protein n=1 Tax=Mycolicibacterium elephantis TaxID=81858 RepID=UPI0007E955EE|nr:MCE family protein [Mycolicibacterium elephantis]OBA85131.1 mammalian cell entry protein [Mycolicibacterium elephantis]
MIRSRGVRIGLAVTLAALLVCGSGVLVAHKLFRPTVIVAHFTTATAIYPGDEVRIAGVKVGSIESIEPIGTQAKMTLSVRHGITVPADAKAVIVAQNLVSARYVQLTPAYESGPAMRDGAVIPVERTAVPVEWNEVKEQLMRLATELGPGGDTGDATGSVGEFIDSAAAAMDGNGDKLRRALEQLSGVGRVLAEGGGNIVDTITNLQAFVTALRESNEQIVQFQNRFATLTSVVNDSRSELDAALKNLSEVVGETTRFVHDTRDKTSEQIQRLANVVQNLAEHRMELENVLHIAPHSIANAVNMFDPRTGAASGVFVLNNMANPDWFICGMIGALQNVTAPTTSKLCSQYLGPGLRLANFNNLPFQFSFLLSANPPPYMLRYSEPSLMPGAGGPPPGPSEPPPAVSAYTGAGDVPPPPGYGPPAAGPTPPAGPPTLHDMLLPAEGSPAQDAAPPPASPPNDGTPP